MGKAFVSSTPERDLAAKRISKEDNVTLSDLSKLKEKIEDTNNTKNIQKQLQDLKKEIEAKNTNDKIQTFWDTMENEAEALFEKFMDDTENKSQLTTIITLSDEATRKTTLQGLATNFEKYLLDNTDKYFDELKAVLGNDFKVELNDLYNEIVNGTSSGSQIPSESSSDHPFFTTPSKETKEQEPYTITHDYVDAYPGRENISMEKGYAIENIYTDKPRQLRKVMERIFDNEEEKKELRTGTFNINLSKENGLAGIIISIREAVKSKDLEDENNPNYPYKKIYDGIRGLSVDETTGSISINGNEQQLKKDIKTLIDQGLLTYNRKGGLDNELNKIAKILIRAKREDLDTFASLLQSKDDIDMAIKEWNNALEITGQTRDDKITKKEKEGYSKESKINENNVFVFLCDFNGDGQLSAAYQKKYNKLQLNQGDVGPVFGQQVMWTIEQAIKVKNAELGNNNGEKIVIHNIVRNMNITDRRSLPQAQKQLLENMMNNQNECTKENLVKLINGYEDNGGTIPGMPELKIFFLDAIKKINGGGKEVTPDLFDTLVGDQTTTLENIVTLEGDIKSTIDQRLEKVKGMNDEQQKELRELIKTQGIVRVRETIFTNIMKVLDNVTITTNDGAQTKLQMAGIEKYREVQSTKKEILEEMVKMLVGGGITYSAKDGLRLTVGVGKTGQSISGKTKRSWSAGPGIIIGPEGVQLYIKVGAELAEQYNYQKVINADLSQVKSAKYLGIEGGAGISVSINNLGAEASAGINRQKDPEIGINQLNKQYEAISANLFDIRKINTNDITDEQNFQAFLYKRIDDFASDPTYGRFITTNRQHLRDNANFIVNYLKLNGFFGQNGKIALLSEYQRVQALQELITLLQAGNIEQRRHDVIAGLHGKIDITKLSFGLTTKALTAKFARGKTTPEPTPSGTAGETPEEGVFGGGYAGNQPEYGTDRFGIAGWYVGMRLSTRRNMYIPQEQQYLYTQYELGQGLGTSEILSPTSDLEKYANYLKALYNDPRINCYKDSQSNKLVITFTPDYNTPKELTLAKFLNLHATEAAKKNFSLEGNKLIVGNVGDIGAYTITEAKGIRRILCLGTKKLDEAQRIATDNLPAQVSEVKDEITGYQALTQKKLQDDFIDKLVGQPGANVESVKTEVSRFFADGKVTIPSNLTDKVRLNPSNLADKQLTTGTLTIRKTTNDQYVISRFDDLPTSFRLTYIDEKAYENARKNAENDNNNREQVFILTNQNQENLFSYETTSELREVQSLLTNLTESLKDIEKNPNETHYAQFLSAASNIIDNEHINNQEITNALNYLQKMLTNQTDSDIKTLKSYLQSDNRYVKAYIIDRLKQIFAKEAWYTGKSLSVILNSHGQKRETITGPSNQAIPNNVLSELTTQRQKRATLTQTYNNNPTIYPNLIGYTAFYRNYGNEYNNIKFSLTSLGNTTSQVEPYVISKNKQEAEQRFLKNFYTNEKEVEFFAQTIEQKLKAKDKSITIYVPGNYPKTKRNIENIFAGKPLDSGEKIIIERDMVFYLLGECCNESVGMMIQSVNVATLKEDVINNLEGKYTATGMPDIIYTKGMTINFKSHSIGSKVLSQEENIQLTHHFTRSTKPRPSGKGGEAPKPTNEGGEGGDPGNITTGGGDNE